MNDDFYFENENAENTPPDSFNKEPEIGDVEIDFSEILDEDVNNSNNVINNEKPSNNAGNPQFREVFQPNYHSYQQGYQQFYNPQFQNSEHAKLYFEKTEVKKVSNKIGIGLIIFFAINSLISFILAPLLLNKEATEFIRDPAITLELNIILSFLGFGIAALYILKVQKVNVTSLISYGLPKKQGFFECVLVAVGFCYVANIVTSMLESSFQNIMPFAEPKIDLPSGALGFAISVLSVAVAPALIEEFLFRSVIMGSLLKFGKAFAIFTSALLFGLVHGNLIQIPFAFLVGLVIGAMVVETNSIWTGVLIHFINNFISICLDYSKNIIDEKLLNFLFLFLIAFLIIVGIFAFYILSVKNKNLFKYEKPNHISSSIQKFGWFSATASIIVYFVIVGLEIFAAQLTSV